MKDSRPLHDQTAGGADCSSLHPTQSHTSIQAGNEKRTQSVDSDDATARLGTAPRATPAQARTARREQAHRHQRRAAHQLEKLASPKPHHSDKRAQATSDERAAGGRQPSHTRGNTHTRADTSVSRAKEGRKVGRARATQNGQQHDSAHSTPRDVSDTRLPNRRTCEARLLEKRVRDAAEVRGAMGLALTTNQKFYRHNRISGLQRQRRNFNCVF